MASLKQIGLGKIHRLDHCRRYFPKYDEKTFHQEIAYTDQQLIQYFPQKFIQQYENFCKIEKNIKIGFWLVDFAFVGLCHKIKLLTKILGVRTWRMFAFKLAAVAFPLAFMTKVEEEAKLQFEKDLYQGVNNLYKKYKRTGDILNLNSSLELEQNGNDFQRINFNDFAVFDNRIAQQSSDSLRE